MLYKATNLNGAPCAGGHGRWSLPTQDADGAWHPGDWMPVIEGQLVPCANGYHLCEDEDVLDWLGPALHEAEYRGDSVEDTNKIVVREARLLRTFTAWDERAQRLFACDCAVHVMPEYTDPRNLACIAVTRRYANGKATEAEVAAAWEATGGVARDAAWNATRDATRHAAWDAAKNAARDAARDAAWDATRDANRDATWFSAWDAARDAARDASWTVTWVAEIQWQYRRLCEYLDGTL